MRTHNLYFLIVLLCSCAIVTFTGCAPVAPYVKPTAPPTGMPGIYHRVEKGDTLWKISKMYNADLERIADINRITDNTKIEIGQQIFIPDAKQPVAQTPKYLSDDFAWPLRGRVISGFSSISNNMVNKGINIQPYGNPDVFAARQGKVVFYSDDFGVFGKTIIIDHGDGLSSVYARNSQVFIKVGDIVSKGACIARTGASGRDRNAYLHFEIRKGYIPQNPSYYLP